MRITPLEALKAVGSGFRRGWDRPFAQNDMNLEDSYDYLGGLACIGAFSLIAVAVTFVVQLVFLPFKILKKILK